MQFKHVTLDIDGPVAILKLDHPEVMNAVSMDMLGGLGEALEWARNPARQGPRRGRHHEQDGRHRQHGPQEPWAAESVLLGMISQARSPAMSECAMPPSSADVARVKIREARGPHHRSSPRAITSCWICWVPSRNAATFAQRK